MAGTEGEQGRLESALRESITESVRIGRFFSKLFTEALHLGADSINFLADQTTMVASLVKDKGELKAINIKPGWYYTVINWLAERVAWDSPNKPPSRAEDPSYEFHVSLRVDTQVVRCKVKRSSLLSKKQSLALTDIRITPCAALVDDLDFTPQGRKVFDGVISARNGAFLISSPTEEALSKVRALMLSLTNAHYAGSISEILPCEQLYQIVKEELVLLSVRSHDSVSAALKLRESGFDPVQIQLLGIVCLGLARRVCPGCGREAIIDGKVIESLPPRLRPVGRYKYLVGRGCAQCGHAGHKGFVGIQSVLRCDAPFIDLLAANASEGELVQHAYTQGTRSLLEDGVHKALEGKLNFESLFEIARTVPDGYLRFLSTAINAGEDLQKLKVADDFFSEPASPSTSKPLTGRSAFSGRSESAVFAGNQPLFAKAEKRKPRTKPMVLIVEDDSDQRAILELCLKGADYEVLLASDGIEALKIAEKELPDLVLSDLMMPNMDGAELVSKLKAHPTLRNIPVLILTVIEDSDKEYALLDLGADDYCEKNVQRKIMLKRVENLIRRSRGQ